MLNIFQRQRYFSQYYEARFTLKKLRLLINLFFLSEDGSLDQHPHPIPNSNIAEKCDNGTGTKFLIKFLITKFLITMFLIKKFLSNKVPNALIHRIPNHKIPNHKKCFLYFVRKYISHKMFSQFCKEIYIVAYNVFSILSGNIYCKKPQCLLFTIRNFYDQEFCD